MEEYTFQVNEGHCYYSDLARKEEDHRPREMHTLRIGFRLTEEYDTAPQRKDGISRIR